ncbi:MAG: hypothetical protein AB1487_07610 [Thermodesulfobacteriota bacterium]
MAAKALDPKSKILPPRTAPILNLPTRVKNPLLDILFSITPIFSAPFPALSLTMVLIFVSLHRTIGLKTYHPPYFDFRAVGYPRPGDARSPQKKPILILLSLYQYLENFLKNSCKLKNGEKFQRRHFWLDFFKASRARARIKRNRPLEREFEYQLNALIYFDLTVFCTLSVMCPKLSMKK